MATYASTRHRDERFRALFEHAPAGVALCDEAGRIVDVNDTVREILDGTGIDPDDASLVDLLRHTPAEADEQDQWPEALEAVRLGTRPVARVQLDLSPSGQAPRLVRATAARVVLGDRAYLMVHLEDATGRRLTEQRLVYLATHDAVTGLANRELVQQRLVAALARAAVSGLPVGVLHIDIERVAEAGEQPGSDDENVLAAVGERLGRVLRAGDSAGRMGEREFLVVACDVAGQTALAELVKRIDATLSAPVRLAAATGTDGAQVSVPLTASIGAVLSRPGEQAGPLVRRADAARYAVKRAMRRQAARARRPAAGSSSTPSRSGRRSRQGDIPAQHRARRTTVHEPTVVVEQH